MSLSSNQLNWLTNHPCVVRITNTLQVRWCVLHALWQIFPRGSVDVGRYCHCLTLLRLKTSWCGPWLVVELNRWPACRLAGTSLSWWWRVISWWSKNRCCHTSCCIPSVLCKLFAYMHIRIIVWHRMHSIVCVSVYVFVTLMYFAKTAEFIEYWDTIWGWLMWAQGTMC